MPAMGPGAEWPNRCGIPTTTTCGSAPPRPCTSCPPVLMRSCRCAGSLTGTCRPVRITSMSGSSIRRVRTTSLEFRPARYRPRGRATPSRRPHGVRALRPGSAADTHRRRTVPGPESGHRHRSGAARRVALLPGADLNPDFRAALRRLTSPDWGCIVIEGPSRTTRRYQVCRKAHECCHCGLLGRTGRLNTSRRQRASNWRRLWKEQPTTDVGKGRELAAFNAIKRGQLVGRRYSDALFLPSLVTPWIQILKRRSTGLNVAPRPRDERNIPPPHIRIRPWLRSGGLAVPAPRRCPGRCGRG